MKPVFETGRLKLVPFDTADINLLHQTLTDPFVRKYLMDDEVITFEKAAAFIGINERCFTDGGWGLWKIFVKAENVFAGIAGLWCFFGEQQPQLLYALLPDQTKQGYAIEASKAIIDYAFNGLQFKYLNASCDTPNAASREVCKKLNMKEAGEAEINSHMTTFYRLES